MIPGALMWPGRGQFQVGCPSVHCARTTVYVRTLSSTVGIVSLCTLTLFTHNLVFCVAETSNDTHSAHRHLSHVGWPVPTVCLAQLPNEASKAPLSWETHSFTRAFAFLIPTSNAIFITLLQTGNQTLTFHHHVPISRRAYFPEGPCNLVFSPWTHQILPAAASGTNLLSPRNCRTEKIAPSRQRRTSVQLQLVASRRPRLILPNTFCQQASGTTTLNTYVR